MNVTDTAILAWHGSRNPAGRRLIERITRRVAGLLPWVTTQIAWVDVEPVLLAQTLATAGDCTVVPCFLTAGYHVSHDIPDAVASAPGEVRVTPHLGGSLDRALLARVAEAGGPGKAVVLASAGSASPTARAEVDAVAARLAGALGVQVRVGTIYQSGPSVGDALAATGEADVLIVPYLLAPGLWCKRLAALDARVAEPLGDHLDVAAAIAGRILRTRRPSAQPALSLLS